MRNMIFLVSLTPFVTIFTLILRDWHQLIILAKSFLMVGSLPDRFNSFSPVSQAILRILMMDDVSKSVTLLPGI